MFSIQSLANKSVIAQFSLSLLLLLTHLRASWFTEKSSICCLNNKDLLIMLILCIQC